MIKDGVVQGAFSCESKVIKNDIAARDPKGDRSSAAIGTRLFSGAFKPMRNLPYGDGGFRALV